MIDRYHELVVAMHNRIDRIDPGEHSFGGTLPEGRLPVPLSELRLPGKGRRRLRLEERHRTRQ
jgi:hypothetical protein